MTQADEHDRIAAEVLARSPVVDGHNDLPLGLRALARGRVDGLDGPRPEFQTDLPRLRAGGVGAQFWSAYVSSSLPEPEAVVATLEELDLIARLVAAYPDRLAPAWTAAQAHAAIASGRIASLIGVEGGHSIAGSTGVLRSFARLGVRYLTLTHVTNTAWADAGTDEPAHGGLTDDGRALVRELGRIGVLADLSHTSRDTQLAALDVATAPVLFSHSSSFAVTPHPRNVDDEVAARAAAASGVIQVTFVPAFVSTALWRWQRDRDAFLAERGASPSFDWPAAPTPAEEERERTEPRAAAARPEPPAALAEWEERHPRPEVTVADVADHVDHLREVAGVRGVGLGGDYDGIDRLPRGLEDVSGYPRLIAELSRRGWSAGDLELLTGKNVLRLLGDAEDAASEPLWPTPPATR
ncbi:membrane dipeptidase [Pseudoclavibacter chungangensis]|uniref:Membrane dipeptidase n=1 Tax=Pseudoclavibacter chungangensis TaxID=587635 RepID=A0A7J5C0P8_9MICO|nr:dipeptidase [Pseudoclavibacter chungangensis]KAB1662196.1 membrane dipeptidase [Pseudoclavibacter chungangensis]NYJ65388.1 membrane dipeptidase [Pseudoclavibacter chungangensis]